MTEEALKSKNLPHDILHIKILIHCYDKCHFMAEQNMEGEKRGRGEEAELAKIFYLFLK